MKNKYLTNLNVFSVYSFFNSLINIDDYINFGKENNLSQLSLVNEKNLYGFDIFYQKCKKSNIKPIIGLNFLCNFDNYQFYFTLFPINNQGYENIINISSFLMTKKEKSFDFQSDFFASFLKKFLQNNIQVISLKKEEDFDFDKLNNIFDKLNPESDLFYFGIEKNFNLNLINQIKKINENIITFNHVRLINEKDLTLLKILKAIKLNEKIDLNKKKEINNEKFHYLTKEELKNNFNSFDDQKLLNFINKINLELDFNKYELNEEKEENNNEEFNKLVINGLKKRFLNQEIPFPYQKRIKEELGLINQKKYNEYFLIVYDCLNFAKKNNIMFGFGRGSVGSSLVAYALSITEIDPIKYDLLFERFLNQDRMELPDIDIDFQDNKRNEIINYLVKKYKKENVCQIITFQKYAWKLAIRDIGRALNIDLETINLICKQVNYLKKENYLKEIENNPILKVNYEKYPYLFEYSKFIINFPRQNSIHPAAIIISKKELTNFVPLQLTENNIFQSQYENYFFNQNQNFLKLDVLGLKTLTILKDMIDLINEKYEKKISFSDLDFNDSLIFQSITKGYTNGIFQLESEGIKSIIQKLKINNFEELIAILALYRPGAIANIKNYHQNKLYPEKIKYENPILKKHLKKTYGVIIYQEQIMLILKDFSNFNLTKTDLIRKAIAKKDNLLMQENEDFFKKEALINGHDQKLIDKVWLNILKFSNYGFNRAHAVGYAILSYFSAYLKFHYPYIFMKVNLMNVLNDQNKLLSYQKECFNLKINLLIPDINKSELDFKIEEKGIRFPLISIKQISNIIASKIIKIRKEKGNFSDLFDFTAKMYSQGINSKHLESLINSGAFDCFEENRTMLLENINIFIRYAKIVNIKKKENYTIDYTLSEKPTLIYKKYDYWLMKVNEKNSLLINLKYKNNY
jgi:DNA polymerase III subunit alpha